MDCERSSIDGLFSNHYLSLFIYKDEIRDADLREVLRERVEPEMVGENRVSD